MSHGDKWAAAGPRCRTWRAGPVVGMAGPRISRRGRQSSQIDCRLYCAWGAAACVAGGRQRSMPRRPPRYHIRQYYMAQPRGGRSGPEMGRDGGFPNRAGRPTTAVSRFPSRPAHSVVDPSLEAHARAAGQTKHDRMRTLETLERHANGLRVLRLTEDKRRGHCKPGTEGPQMRAL